MFMAEKTVKNYVSSMLAKLGLQCRTQAALFAARHMPELPDVDATLTQPGSLPIRCRNPESTGIRLLGLTAPAEAQSSAVVRSSVSGAVLVVCYSAGSDNRRCQ